MSNKRKYDRYDLSLAVYLKDRKGTHPMATGNISKYGLFLVTTDIRPSRQLVQLVIEFPNKSEIINALAQVMWVDETGTSERSEGQPGMGVKFFSLPDQERQKWEAFVDMVRTGRIKREDFGSSAKKGPTTIEEAGEKVYTIGEEELDELEDLDIESIGEEIEEEIIDIEEDVIDQGPVEDLSAYEEEYEKEGVNVDDMAGEDERRQYPRKPVSFLLKMKDVEEMRELFSRDISLGGMFIKTQMKREIGENIEVVIVHPWTGEEFAMDAKVRRHENNEAGNLAGFGVEFLAMDDDLRDSLLTYIESGYVIQKSEDDSTIEAEVIRRIESVEAKIAENPIESSLHYEVGLLHLCLSDWEKAKEHVDIADKLGFNVPDDVKNMLSEKA